MTYQHLYDLQELMMRTYVRNVMFFATLPYYLAQEVRREQGVVGGQKLQRANHE
jgi:hypothetical protein